MTTDIAIPFASYTVSGIGPYTLGWPYQASEVTVFAQVAGAAPVALTPTIDWTITPEASDVGGALLLSPAVALAHAGRRLLIQRQTTREQGFAGQSAREVGLEANMDRLMRSVQDIDAKLRSVPVFPGSVIAAGAVAEGRGLLFSGGAFVPGATEAEIASAADAAVAAASAAADATAAAAAASAAASVLTGFAIPAWGTFTTDNGLTNGRGPYALPYDPIAVEYVDLTVGGVPQVPGVGNDFTLTYSGAVAQILLSFDMPSGTVCNFRLQRPLAYDPNALLVNPQQFGAIGDGIADDTVAITAAVAYALANNRQLYLAGTYLTSASIPDLHNIEKFGPGAIKVGLVTVPVTPRRANSVTIYVSPAGSATNDGLDAGRAVSTVTRALEVVRAFDAYVQGTWTIQLAAGTYTDAITPSGLFFKDNRITIQGPVAGHPNVPTAIIAAPAITDIGLQLTLGHRFRLIDILFSGFSNGQAINNNGGFLSLVNVHGITCARGVIGQNHAFTAFTGGIWDGTGGGSGSIGYTGYYNAVHDSGAASTATATIFQDYAAGLQIGEGSQGHLDYIILQDNSTGVDFKRGCGACNTDNMTIRRNAVGVKAHNAPWYDNQIIWGTGADANTVNVDARGSAPEQKRQTLDYRMKAMRVSGSNDVIPTITLAATAVLEPLFAGPIIPDWAISEGGDQIEFTACLRLALTGNMALRAYLAQGATIDQFANITVNAAATALYLTIRGSFDNEASFRGYIHAVDNVGTIYSANSDSVLNFKNTAGNFLVQISGTVANTITGWTVSYQDTVAG